MVLKKSENNTLKKIISTLLHNGIVIMPCDTIYGIISIAGSPENRIRDIKGRDNDKPFIYLIESKDKIHDFTDTEIKDEILDLWPGPLTLIVSDKMGSTTALRVPEDDYLIELLSAIKQPVVSTSVNFSGKPSLNRISEITDSFENLVDIIIDGGDCDESPLPSTILDITESPFTVLRQGKCKIPEYLLKHNPQ